MAIFRTERLFARAFKAWEVAAHQMKKLGKSQAEIDKVVGEMKSKAQALNQRGRNLAGNVKSTQGQINTLNKNQAQLTDLMQQQSAATQKYNNTTGVMSRITGKRRAAGKEVQNLSDKITQATQKNGTLEQMSAQRNNLNQMLETDKQALETFRNSNRGVSVNKQADSMIEGNQTFFQKRRQRRGELKQQMTAKRRAARSKAAQAEHHGQGDTAINDLIRREEELGRTGEFTQTRGQKKGIARSETTLAGKQPQTQAVPGGTTTAAATPPPANTPPATPPPATGAQAPAAGGQQVPPTTGGTTTGQNKGSWWSRLTGAQKGGIIGGGSLLGGAGLTAGLMGGGGGTAATVAGVASAPTLAAGYYYANKPREAAFSKIRLRHVHRR